jgi:RNA polymerase subunit RPABC4/transcription elongation factor Spt4
MKRLSEELRIVPRIAWFIAALAYLALLSILVHASKNDPSIREWPLWGKLLFGGLMPLLLVCYVVLIGYVNADARRRGMRYVMWTLLAMFTPNALGIILYFVLRDPLMRPCPHCATLLKHGFAFCPHCGTALTQACPRCQKMVEPGWSHCVACGAKLA